MDRYAARLLLTAIMFGAVAVSATLFSDALTQTAGSEPLPVAAYGETGRQETSHEMTSNMQTQYSVSVRTQPAAAAEFVTVLDAEGAAVGNWQTDEAGQTVIGPLVPGTYYARGKYTGYAQIILKDNAAVTVQAGCGWSDGEVLYLTDFEPSRLTINCTQPNANSGIVTLTLLAEDGQSYERTGILESGTATLIFDGLPAGAYELFHGNTGLQTFNIDGETSLSITLPAN